VPEPEQIGDMRQRGLRAGLVFDACAAPVRDLGETIRSSLNGSLPAGTAPIPAFNTVTWGQTDGGISYISRHRDPPTAGGVIVVATLAGRAVFRIWRDTEPAEWETADGDVVIIRGTGWPTSEWRCPVHEARSHDDARRTLTFRHNIRGPGADYFD
jgi:hypothetical protein